MAAKMTPGEFAKLYLELDLFLYDPEYAPGGTKAGYIPPKKWTKVKANRYRLHTSEYYYKFWYDDIQYHFSKPVEVTVMSIQGIPETTELKAKDAQMHFKAPFEGKGSPEQVQIAMQLVYRFHKASTSIHQFATERHFVGLDCNGFVGNYYQRIVKNQDWKTAEWWKGRGPESYMSDMITWGQQMKTAEELKPDDTYILVWCDKEGTIFDPDPTSDDPTKAGHVMITQPKTMSGSPGDLKVKIWEATAADDGYLRPMDTVIKSASQKGNIGVFAFERGTPAPPNDGVDFVRICRLDLGD
jgi:hypothetical protein